MTNDVVYLADVDAGALHRQNQFDARCGQIRQEAGQAFRDGVPKSAKPYAEDLQLAAVWRGGYAEAALGISIEGPDAIASMKADAEARRAEAATATDGKAAMLIRVAIILEQCAAEMQADLEGSLQPG